MIFDVALLRDSSMVSVLKNLIIRVISCLVLSQIIGKGALADTGQGFFQLATPIPHHDCVGPLYQCALQGIKPTLDEVR